MANAESSTGNAGPATSVSAANPIATRGKVSVSGRPRPAGRPIARAAATIDTTQAAAAATPMSPRKSPASKVASIPTTRAPNANPGARPAAAAISSRDERRARWGSKGRHAASTPTVASMTRPATSPTGVPRTMAISAKPPSPGITSPRYSRLVVAHLVGPHEQIEAQRVQGGDRHACGSQRRSRPELGGPSAPWKEAGRHECGGGEEREDRDGERGHWDGRIHLRSAHDLQDGAGPAEGQPRRQKRPPRRAGGSNVLDIQLDHRQRRGRAAGEGGEQNTSSFHRQHRGPHSEGRDRALLPAARLESQEDGGRDENDEAEREGDTVKPQIEPGPKAQRSEVQLLGGAHGEPQDEQREHRSPRAGAHQRTAWPEPREAQGCGQAAGGQR